MKMPYFTRLLRDAGVKFWRDNGPWLGAALAFYLSLSLSPLLLTLVMIAGAVFGAEAARGELVGQLRATVGQEAAVVIEQMLARSSSTEQGIWAGLVVVATLVVGASGIFSSLQSALNRIWQVPGIPASSGILTMFRERLSSFLLVCVTALLVIVSLIATAVLTSLDSRMVRWLPGAAPLAEIGHLVVSLVLTSVLFAMIFKWLPEVDLGWRDVWLGAFITALMFTIGRYPIGLYLGTVATSSVYGAAGAFAVLLVWIYYSSQILLFGAELTFVHARGRLAENPAAPAGAKHAASPAGNQ
jgi:membrane protein